MTDSSTSKRSNRALVVVAVAVVAAMVLAGMTAMGGSSGNGASGTSTTTSESSEGSSTPDPAKELPRRQQGDPMAKGDVDAPVVMVAYSDFQCPFCARFATEIEPELQHHIDDGTLRIEWRDFPYLGEESMIAARGARAAAEQDTFWEFHDALFADQAKQPNSGRITKQYLIDTADELGLDTAQFEQDFEDKDLVEDIEADFAEGHDMRVTGTPTFIINDLVVVGAQPVETFEQAIEDVRQKAQE